MIARLILIGITCAVCAYDVWAMVFGLTTISQEIRICDAQVGGLIRWGWLALWCHFFIAPWAGPSPTTP